MPARAGRIRTLIICGAVTGSLVLAAPADRSTESGFQAPTQAGKTLEDVAREAVNQAFHEDGATWAGERDADGSVILRSPDGTEVVFAKPDAPVETWRRDYKGDWEHGYIQNGTHIVLNVSGNDTRRPPRCRPGGVVRLPPTAGPNAPKPPIAGPPAVPPGGEPLPSSQVRDFQQKFIDDLTAKAKSVTGTKDAKGNFVVDGIAISPTTVNGLILTRDTFISDLDGWIAEIDRVQSLSLDEKKQLVQSLDKNSDITKLWAEYQKFKSASVQAKGLHDEPHQYYIDRMKIADELERLQLEHPGTVATRNGLTANDYRQLAKDSEYGWFVTMQHRFYEQLSKNKLLAIRKDGKYLFEAWMTDVPYGASLQARMDLFNDYLDAGRETAKQQKTKAAGDTSIDALMKYGGPQYSSQHIKAATIGKAMGATLPQLEIDEVQAVFHGVTLSREFWDNLTEATLNAAMAASILIPGGPLIAGGIAIIQITRDGSDLVVSLLTEEEAKNNASVSGYQYVITAQDRADAAKGKFLLTVAMSVPNLIGLSEIRNIKLLKGTKAASSAGNAAGAAAKAVTAAEEGLDAIAAELGKEVADGVKAGRELGVAEGELQSMLTAARVNGEAATMPHGQMVKMAASALPKVSEKGLILLQTVQKAAAARHILADLAKVQELMTTARGLGLSEEAVQTMLKAALEKNSISSMTELLARDIQVAEVNLKDGVILVDNEIPEATLANRQPMSTADLVENYTNTVQPKKVQNVHFGVDELDSVAAKVEVGANPNAMGVELTNDQWLAANAMAEYPGQLEKFYKLNPDQNGFVQVFDKGFEAKFEAFLIREAPTDARARSILAKWNARKAALSESPTVRMLPAARAVNPDIPSVLRNPATGDYLSPEAILRLSREDLATLPATFNIDESVPNAVAKALGHRLTTLAKESTAAKAAAVPAFPVPKIGFNVESRIQRLTNEIILDAEHFSAGIDALDGAVRPWSNNRVGGFAIRRPSDPPDLATYHMLTHPEFAGVPESGSAMSFGLFDEVCAEPMTIEPPESVNMLAANGAPDDEPQKFGALLHLPDAIPGLKSFEPMSARTGRLLDRLLALIEPRVSAQSAQHTPAVGQSAVKIAFASLGVATGEAFDVSAINDGDEPVTLDADGIVLEAVAKGSQDKVAKQFADAIRARGARAPSPTVAHIEAYCLDYEKLPPRAGTIFRVANSATQVKNGWMRQLLQAEKRLEKSGAFQPGANPDAAYRTLRQWAIWAYAQHFTRDGFLKAFVDHAKKNFAATGKSFTSAIAADVAAQAAQFYRAVTDVIHDAQLDIDK